MPHLLVRHKVSDFSKWKSAYDAHSPARKEVGLKEEHLLRNMDNPNEVILLFEVNDLQKAKEFSASAGMCRQIATLLPSFSAIGENDGRS